MLVAQVERGELDFELVTDPHAVAGLILTFLQKLPSTHDTLTHSLTDSLTDSLVYMNLKILLQPGVHSVTSCVEFGASNVTISYETDLTH